VIIRPLAVIGPEVILAKVERNEAGAEDEIKLTDVLERSEKTLWLSSLSPELKEFLLRKNDEANHNFRLLQEVLNAAVEPGSTARPLSVVSLGLTQGNEHLGSLHLISEKPDFHLRDSSKDFLVNLALQVSVLLENRSLQYSTRVDSLTRLYNRGYMMDRLREEMTRTSRTDRPFSLLMLDVEHFKQVNDTYGHQAGDEILVGLAALLKRTCRASDAICRYGGEEIAVILADTALEGAKVFAENLRKGIEADAFPIPESRAIRITASMGVAEYPGQATSVEELIKKADAALYEAKHSGRNAWRAAK
jgi:diguanylate cyclase (GGDEF)-like protein